MDYQQNVFITGVTGLLGGEHLRRQLLWSPDSRVIALMRGIDDAAVEKQSEILMASVFPDEEQRHSVAKRVKFVRGDVAAPKLGLAPALYSEVATSITDIAHFASDTRFHLTLEEARTNNVGGTQHILELAKQGLKTKNFHRLHYASTYAVGRPDKDTGIVYEVAAPFNTAYTNSYEQTKSESEALLLSQAGEVPISIHRISIVAGESSMGWTGDYKVFYLILKLFARGYLTSETPLLITPGSLIDIIPLDYCADVFFALSTLDHEPSGSIFQIVLGKMAFETKPTLILATEFMRQLMQERGKTLPPSITIQEVEYLDESVLHKYFKDEVVRSTVASLLPYFTKNYMYDDTHTRQAIEKFSITQLEDRDIDDFVSKVISYCLDSEWGRRPSKRPPLHKSVLRRVANKNEEKPRKAF